MTDLEKVELAVRRVVKNMPGEPWIDPRIDQAIRLALNLLAEELAAITKIDSAR